MTLDKYRSTNEDPLFSKFKLLLARGKNMGVAGEDQFQNSVGVFNQSKNQSR